MKTDRCNSKCQPDKDIHWLKDRYFTEGKCAGCGSESKPHYGFGFPCPASHSGIHYLDPDQAKRNAEKSKGI